MNLKHQSRREEGRRRPKDYGGPEPDYKIRSLMTFYSASTILLGSIIGRMELSTIGANLVVSQSGLDCKYNRRMTSTMKDIYTISDSPLKLNLDAVRPKSGRAIPSRLVVRDLLM